VVRVLIGRFVYCADCEEPKEAKEDRAHMAVSELEKDPK
jgi:hypothetical protein